MEKVQKIFSLTSHKNKQKREHFNSLNHKAYAFLKLLKNNSYWHK